tara:strand:+ start:61 stop:750 length:690 start_codon:yes stop_codon:yes gene_type:complete
MADGGTIEHRITDLIGSIYSTEAAYAGDLINAAINEISDMVSEEVLLKYSPSPTAVTSVSGVSVEGKRILKVTRVDADSSGIERECRGLDRIEFSAARDTGSIHYATAHSPVYRLDSMNAATTLVIFPNCNSSGQEGNIFYFPYVADSYDPLAITGATLNTSLFLPETLIHAVALKSSINILKAYISNQVQDEEDIELMQMITSQMQILEKDFQTEMQRYTGTGEAKAE